MFLRVTFFYEVAQARTSGMEMARPGLLVIQTPMRGTEQPHLVRAIGRWGLAALIINSIVGSGIFGLPTPVAKALGPLSPLAVLLAGGAVGVIIACHAEVASQFSEAGGPYLYARVAFGRFLGIQIGWMLWLSRLTAPAAAANLFVTYLAGLWPQASGWSLRCAVLTVLVGTLAFVNVRGVRTGAQVSSLFTVAKLIPLFLIAIMGTFYLLSKHAGQPSAAHSTSADAWLRALLLLVFAYGGFETALGPMSEAENPRRDVAFGLFIALITCTVLYVLLQWVVVGVLPGPAYAERPLADVASVVLGRGGATLVALGAMVSAYGYLSANILAVPRITFALAENGDFPKVFAAVHPRFRTPYFSLLVFAVLTWLLALFGTFSWNVTLSSVARLFYYGTGCAALLALRRKPSGAPMFRLKGGTVFAVLGILICMVLITRVDRSGLLILLATIAAALINWLVVRKRALPVSAAAQC